MLPSFMDKGGPRVSLVPRPITLVLPLEAAPTFLTVSRRV
jgi:hypothetical protein